MTTETPRDDHDHDQAQDASANPAEVAEEVAQESEAAASAADDVRRRVREAVLNAVNTRTLRLGEVRRAVDAALAGAARGVKSVSVDRQGTVLSETVSGVSDAVARAANATRLALREAESRGQRFADEDLKRTADDLRVLDEMLVETVRSFAARSSAEMKGATGDLVDHTRRTTEDARKDVMAALEAAMREPGKLVGETGKAATDLAREGVGSIFQVASGLLGAVGDVSKKGNRQ